MNVQQLSLSVLHNAIYICYILPFYNRNLGVYLLYIYT